MLWAGNAVRLVLASWDELAQALGTEVHLFEHNSDWGIVLGRQAPEAPSIDTLFRARPGDWASRSAERGSLVLAGGPCRELG